MGPSGTCSVCIIFVKPYEIANHTGMKVILVSCKHPPYLTWLLETGYERVNVFASDDMWL